MKDAIELIREERERQKNVEGWTPEHDDEHKYNQLANAAATYAMDANCRDDLMHLAYDCDIDGISPTLEKSTPPTWPWDEEWWKPTPNDRIRELVKAGALIVAEIERLQRLT